MEKQLWNKFTTITSTLFESFVAMYQVCDKDETDEYFKHYAVLIFKDRKPHTIYGIRSKDLSALLDELRYLYQYTNEEESK